MPMKYWIKMSNFEWNFSLPRPNCLVSIPIKCASPVRIFFNEDWCERNIRLWFERAISVMNDFTNVSKQRILNMSICVFILTWISLGKPNAFECFNLMEKITTFKTYFTENETENGKKCNEDLRSSEFLFKWVILYLTHTYQLSRLNYCDLLHGIWLSIFVVKVGRPVRRGTTDLNPFLNINQWDVEISNHPFCKQNKYQKHAFFHVSLIVMWSIRTIVDWNVCKPKYFQVITV